MRQAALDKRGFWRATFAGIGAHYVSLLAFLVVLHLLRPLFWAAVYGVPHVKSSGPIDPNTNEWLLLQAINFLSWVIAGLATAKWSKLGSFSSFIALLCLFTVLIIVSPLPATGSALRITIWLLEVPLGIACGALLYFRLTHRPFPSTVT